MSSKIDVTQVLTDHLDTFRDYGTGQRRKMDYTLFLVAPTIAAGIMVWFLGVNVTDSSIGVLITVYSVFAALLFNLLLLIYDIKSKRDHAGALSTDEKQLLIEVYSNVSFCILLPIVGTLLLLVLLWNGMMMFAREILLWVVYSLSGIFVLTLLMILKRIHVLLTTEFAQSD